MSSHDLIALLEAHRGVDQLEEEHRRSILELVRDVEDPFDRTRYEPGHVTASGFVTDAARRRVLLIHHRKLDKWLQPGGHVDPGDADAAAAAAREIREETGVAGLSVIDGGLLDVDVHDFPGRPGGDPFHLHFDVRFGFVATETEVEVNHEVRDARWVARAELAGLGVGPSVLRPVGKLLVDLS